MSEESQPTNTLYRDIVNDYLSLWQNHWQEMWQAWDPQNLVSSLFSQAGFSTAALVAQNPFLLRKARHPSRALSLHLTMTLAIWGAAQSNLLPFSKGMVKFNDPSASLLQQKIEKIGWSLFSRILTQAVVERSVHLTQGIHGYLNHSYDRPESNLPVVWRHGATRLIDYGLKNHRSDDPIMLFIPSLINRSYILDLKPGQSLLSFLAQQGIRPFLLDWGAPGPEEEAFGLDEYYLKGVEPAYNYLKSLGEISVAGYCMGGIFATALAQSHPSIKKLILLATPWDFSQHPMPLPGFFETILTYLEKSSHAPSTLPPEVLQLLFYGLQSGKIFEKYMNFCALDPSSSKAENFVALEDWVNDGVALTRKATRQCFTEWFEQNLPAKGLWKIGDLTVNPSMLTQPSYLVGGEFDRIVPPASLKKLSDSIRDATLQMARFGHTGIMASPRAQKEVWEPILKWFKEEK